MLLSTVAFGLIMAVVESREIVRPLPTISNSLVNLGKMEISFYLNGHDPPKFAYTQQTPSSFFFPKSEPVYDEPCLCSSLKNIKDSFFSNPTGILNKLLMNNDIFSSNKEPVTSTLCCESHEHVEEGTVVFEFPPLKMSKPNRPKLDFNPMPFMPFIFENFTSKNSLLPQLKTKSIEILLFPKKKEEGVDFSKLHPKKKEILKDGIQIVGNKDVKNSFISVPTPPQNFQKESLQQEENEKEKKFNANIESSNKLNAV